MLLENRAHAGELLARRLAPYKSLHPLILAIPRGAVPMGQILAEALDGDLDVVLVRKLRAPNAPELAIGSIDEIGRVYLDPDTRSLWTETYLVTEKQIQLDTIRRRRDLYRASAPPIDPAGRTVIVLDDGVATGSTMIAALRAVRARQPAELIAAAGVASPEALQRISVEADQVVCLETPCELYAIGYHFRDFSPVTDDEVVAALGAARTRNAAAGASQSPRESPMTPKPVEPNVR